MYCKCVNGKPCKWLSPNQLLRKYIKTEAIFSKTEEGCAGYLHKERYRFIHLLVGVLHIVQEHFTYRMGASIIGWEQTGHNLGWNPWPSVVCWTNFPSRTGEGDSLRWLTWLTFFQLRQTTLNSTPPVCEASFKGAQHTTCQKKAANAMLSRLLWKCDAYVSMLLLSCVYIYICTWLHGIM